MATLESLDAEQSAIARRQRIADMLMQQSQEPLDTNQMAGGYVVPVSQLAGVAKVAQALSGAYIGKKADAQESEYNAKKRADLAAIDLNSPNAPQELIKNDMFEEAIKLRQDQVIAAREAEKAKREGVPNGFIINDQGKMSGYPMENGGTYEDVLLQRAIAAKRVPGYGDSERLGIAQSANDIALQELAMKQQEQQRKAMEALQPQLRPLPAGNANTLAEGNNLKTGILNELRTTITDNKDMFGPIEGRYHALNPYDEKGQKIQATLARARQVIGSYLENGVLRKEDEIKYERMLPKLGEVDNVALDKLDKVEALLANKHKEYLDAYRKSGFDMREFDIPDNATGGKISNEQALIEAKKLRDNGQVKKADQLQQMIEEPKRQLSKSGKPMIFINGNWEYE